MQWHNRPILHPGYVMKAHGIPGNYISIVNGTILGGPNVKGVVARTLDSIFSAGIHFRGSIRGDVNVVVNVGIAIDRHISQVHEMVSKRATWKQLIRRMVTQTAFYVFIDEIEVAWRLGVNLRACR